MQTNKRLLRYINIKKFISKYSLEWKQSGNDLVMRCPFHKDMKASFAMRFKGERKGNFICYSGNCGKTGDFITFISDMEGISRYNAVQIIEEKYETGKTYNLDKVKKRIRKAGKDISDGLKEIEKQVIVNLTIEHEDSLSKNEQKKKLFKYLKKERLYKNKKRMEKIIKHFDIKVVKHCKIGFAICIPILFNGRTIAYYYERYGDRQRKLYSTESKVSKFLFHFKTKPIKNIVIVEGIWDMIKVWSSGIKNVTTCFTSRLSLEQSYLLNEYVDRVIVFFDGDKSGRDGNRKAKKLLEPTNKVSVIKTPKGKDPDNMNSSNIREIAGFAIIPK